MEEKMKNHCLCITTKEFVIALLGVLLLFYQYLVTYVSGAFGYIDEIITLVFFVIYFILKKYKNKTDINLLFFLLLFVIFGLIGNYLSAIQSSSVAIFIDVITCSKYFLLFIGLKGFSSTLTDNNKIRIIQFTTKIVRIFIIITFICCIINLFADIGVGNEPRFGIRSFKFININAGSLSMMFYPLLIIQTLNIKYTKARSKNFIYICITLFVWMTTLRTRAFLFVAFYLYMYFVLIIRKSKFKLNFVHIVIIGLMLYLLAYDQYSYYFLENETQRSLLFRNGITTFREYFPYGSGFGTYGTDAAFKFYSPLYYKYGFNIVYGLDPVYGGITSDNFWPAVLGQFSLVGGTFYVIMLFISLKQIFNMTRKDEIILLASVFFIFTQLVSSSATSVFFHPNIVVTLFFLSFAFNIKNRK